MGISFIPFIVVAMVPIITGNFGQRVIGKRNSADSNIANVDYPDYSTKYDDYPVVVPKRAALLLDQLMVALQKVVDNQGKSTVGESRGMSRGMSRGTKVSAPRFIANTEIADDQTMDLQRRGQAKGQVYWRCYFNAVTCFKRK
ncbi:uncharacterized protein LOC114929111 isoform X2 [Nylanderia fulva]|uniref:uncharacterized protein LOC114929111 isoform X2 n=1 Tax=Nylanderia fulva TaxID=613905 RepID=UPI0010FB6304|nr:uncharacterized protein LOC114929111 isoform X2 [Nylanderia fulva]